MNDLLERLAHTHTLGRYVAPRWNLERNMHWRQMVGFRHKTVKACCSRRTDMVFILFEIIRSDQMGDQLD